MRRFQFITLLILLLYSMGSYSAAQNLPDVVPPPSGNNQPVDVKIGLYLIHIVKIDQPNQTLSGLFEITMLWKDDRLSFQSLDGAPKNYSGADADKILATIWAPDPEIVNQARKIISPYSLTALLYTDTYSPQISLPSLITQGFHLTIRS